MSPLELPPACVFPVVMDKIRLRQALLEKLNTEIATQAQAAFMARDEATHHESRAQNKYDTHAQEAAYLAQGQARLAAELQDSVAVYHALPLPTFRPEQAIELGAVVTLEAGKRVTYYVLGPRNGGLEVLLDDLLLLVVTPQSPLGRNLIGRRVGDTVSLPGPGGPVVHQITSVQ